jgi:hypothetical protein
MKTNLVNAVREVIDVRHYNLVKHINTLFGQKAEFLDVKCDGSCSYHWVLSS